MRIFIAASSASLLLVCAHASAADKAPATPPNAAAAADAAKAKAPSSPAEVSNTGVPGQAAATRTEKVSAKVKAVDAANRTVTLVGKDGVAETVKVSPEVKRFNEIAPGDTVVVEFEQGLLLEYQAAGSETVPPQAVVAAERGAADAPPAAAAAAGVQGTVVVTAIDSTNRLVVFQGPKGKLHQVKAGPNVQLEKLKVGDRLLATYVEAVAIKLEKAKPSEKSKEKKK